MRPTQTEQIRAAKRAYILTLNRNRSRFSVYLDGGNGLEVLWPSDNHLVPKHKDKLPYQQYRRSGDGPAFVFALNGCGYSKLGALAEELRRINPAIAVESLEGSSPSRH